jgi:hypothetical protein
MEGLGLEDTEGDRLPGHGLGADVGDEPVEDPAPNSFGDDRGVKRRSHDRGFVHVGGEAPCSGDIGCPEPRHAQSGRQDLGHAGDVPGPFRRRSARAGSAAAARKHRLR